MRGEWGSTSDIFLVFRFTFSSRERKSYVVEIWKIHRLYFCIDNIQVPDHLISSLELSHQFPRVSSCEQHLPCLWNILKGSRDNCLAILTDLDLPCLDILDNLLEHRASLAFEHGIDHDELDICQHEFDNRMPSQLTPLTSSLLLMI